jgi:hypothetical protein
LNWSFKTLRTMNKLIKILPFLLLTACQLITEPDLSDKSVYLIAPIDSMSTTTATHTLWWDVIPDAEAYNVIVVSPDWNSIERLVAIPMFRVTSLP